MSKTECEICNKKAATHKCSICGRRACDDDFNHLKGHCLVCENALCKLCGNHLSIGTCKHCGRHACERCLVQVSLIEYVCIECYRRGLR
ncbi:MAG: hypothetical protein QXK88_04620 [Desulfurococcaceae archaeon]